MNRHESDSLNTGYCEFLTPVKASGKAIMLRILIVAAAVLISAGMLIVTLKTIPIISFILLVLIIFFSWFAYQFTKIEYEYVIATGVFELSKIFGARTRKKILEFKTSEIYSVTPLIDIKSLGIPESDVIFACNKNVSDAVCLAYTSGGSVKKAVVISAPSKTISCLKHYRRSAFSPLMKI